MHHVRCRHGSPGRVNVGGVVDRSSVDPRELRLLAKVARLYDEKGLGQSEIGAQMDLSQATVSHLLKNSPTAEVHATRLTQRLAQLLGGQAVLLRLPES